MLSIAICNLPLRDVNIGSLEVVLLHVNASYCSDTDFLALNAPKLMSSKNVQQKWRFQPEWSVTSLKDNTVVEERVLFDWLVWKECASETTVTIKFNGIFTWQKRKWLVNNFGLAIGYVKHGSPKVVDKDLQGRLRMSQLTFCLAFSKNKKRKKEKDIDINRLQKW